MHAAVADGVDRAAFQLASTGRPAPGRLGEDEAVAVGPVLLDDEHRDAAVGLRPVRVGAGQQHEHVRPGGERAPGLDAVDQPAAVGAGGRRHDVGDVGAVVRLGDRHRGQSLAAGQLGQPLDLLLLGAAVEQRPREDLRPGDERAADAEGPPAQLLGGDDHAQVVALVAGGEAAVLLRHRQAEAAELGQAGDQLLGDVAVRPVDVLGPRPDLVLGEPVERLAGQLEVVAQVPRSGLTAQAGQHGRVALRVHERPGRRKAWPASTPHWVRGRPAG